MRQNFFLVATHIFWKIFVFNDIDEVEHLKNIVLVGYSYSHHIFYAQALKLNKQHLFDTIDEC